MRNVKTEQGITIILWDLACHRLCVLGIPIAFPEFLMSLSNMASALNLNLHLNELK